MMRFLQWSMRPLLLVGIICVVFGAFLLAVTFFMKPEVERPQIVPKRIRLPILSIRRGEEPTIPGVVGKKGIAEKPSEGRIPEEQKPVVPKSSEPPMMVPEKGLDEKVIMIGETELPKAEKITQILVDNGEQVMHVTLIADRKMGDYNCFRLKKPPRLVIDIWNVKTEYPKRLIQVDHPLLKRVRLQNHPKKTRFVFESSGPQVPLFRVKKVGKRLVVSFGQVYPP